MPIFRVTSEKIYTGQKNFTRAPPVAPVTNIRYGSWLKQPHKYSILCKHALPLLFIESSIISRGQRMHYKYSGHQRRVIQTFDVGNNIQRTYTGYPAIERSAKRANTSQHTSAEPNTSNTHSNNIRIGYD